MAVLREARLVKTDDQDGKDSGFYVHTDQIPWVVKPLIPGRRALYRWTEEFYKGAVYCGAWLNNELAIYNFKMLFRLLWRTLLLWIQFVTPLAVAAALYY